jgi:ubiquitin-like protein Pup
LDGSDSFKAAPDELLDEIDQVLTENAENFAHAYAQKGGQGWSLILDPAFFTGAVAAGVAAEATYDAVKGGITRLLKALRGSEHGYLSGTGEIDPGLEEMLRRQWDLSCGVVSDEPPQHSIDEAQAVHWILFFRDLIRTRRLVSLRPDHYVLALNAASGPEQFVAGAIDHWLIDHPIASSAVKGKRQRSGSAKVKKQPSSPVRVKKQRSNSVYVYRHGSCPVKHQSAEAAQRCRNS